MTTPTTRIDALRTAIRESVSINDKNVVELKDGAKIWESNLPAGVTAAAVVDLGEYRRDFGAAFQAEVGEAIVKHAKANKDIGYMRGGLETADVDYAFEFTAPQVKKGKKLTSEVVAAGIAMTTYVRASDTLESVQKELVKLWDL